MNDQYLLVKVYHKNHFYTEKEFPIDGINEAIEYKKHWEQKEGFTADIYKVTQEVTED